MYRFVIASALVTTQAIIAMLAVVGYSEIVKDEQTLSQPMKYLIEAILYVQPFVVIGLSLLVITAHPVQTVRNFIQQLRNPNRRN